MCLKPASEQLYWNEAIILGFHYEPSSEADPKVILSNSNTNLIII